MSIRKNRIGERYGRLTIIADLPTRVSDSGKAHTVVLCRCDCGKEKEFLLSNVLRAKDGRCISCGCWGRECAEKLNKKTGLSRIPEYFIWNSMKERCYNPNSFGYKWYGANGVVVCDRWRNSFENFIEDMGMRPSNKHSIDRHPNKEGNYEPNNCRWATTTEQARNKSNNIQYVFRGENRLLIDLCEEFGVSYGTVRTRLRIGWDIERAVTEPIDTKVRECFLRKKQNKTIS